MMSGPFTSLFSVSIQVVRVKPMGFSRIALSICVLVSSNQLASAGLFLIDFCAGTQARCLGSAPDWDAFTSAFPGEEFVLTDWSEGGADDDVIMTLVPNDDEGLLNMWPNHTSPPDEGSEVNGIEVPLEALADYWYRNPDTAGFSALLQFEGLDPGQYDVMVFEGRVTDGFQEGKIWVGDEDGSGEPDEANTGNFALSEFKTVGVTIDEDELLFYRHLEDGSGGISGMIIQSTAPRTPGDYNGDNVVDATDVDLQAAAMQVPNPDLSIFDEDGDGAVNNKDRSIWVHDHVGTWFGDADLNREFNSGDLVSVFTTGKYESGERAGWSEGDWNGDLLFDSTDFVAAFTDGGYEQGPPRDNANVVPEPASLMPLMVGLTAIASRRRHVRWQIS